MNKKKIDKASKEIAEFLKKSATFDEVALIAVGTKPVDENKQDMHSVSLLDNINLLTAARLILNALVHSYKRASKDTDDIRNIYLKLLISLGLEK